jgi:hypothetical protein
MAGFQVKFQQVLTFARGDHGLSGGPELRSMRVLWHERHLGGDVPDTNISYDVRVRKCRRQTFTKANENQAEGSTRKHREMTSEGQASSGACRTRGLHSTYQVTTCTSREAYRHTGIQARQDFIEAFPKEPPIVCATFSGSEAHQMAQISYEYYLYF